MTIAFEHHTGLLGVRATTDDPTGFVAALTTTFLAAAVLSLGTVAASVARGSDKP
jgi:hypothetical protein